jgi:hypothetical protein
VKYAAGAVGALLVLAGAAYVTVWLSERAIHEAMPERLRRRGL